MRPRQKAVQLKQLGRTPSGVMSAATIGRSLVPVRAKTRIIRAIREPDSRRLQGNRLRLTEEIARLEFAPVGAGQNSEGSCACQLNYPASLRFVRGLVLVIHSSFVIRPPRRSAAKA